MEPGLEAKLRETLRTRMATQDAAHMFDHVLQVVKNAKFLLQGVECNARVVLAAAYVHDLCSRREFEGRDVHDASAEAASPILKQLDYEPTEIVLIADCVRTASWEHSIAGGIPSTVEAKVLRDADWLEAMGATGISRVFAFAGSYDLPLTPVDVDPLHPQRLPAYVCGPDPSPFYHFYSKLLWLKSGLQFQNAKVEGERRHQLMIRFLLEHRREQNWGAQAGV